MNINLINTVCKKIIGLNIYRVSRASDMLCLEIGEEISYKNLCKVGQYTFHIQCPWRISNEEILLGSRDIYTPGSKIDYEEFDWSTIGSSRFDERILKLYRNWDKTVSVRDIKISKVGDLKISFENGVIFETFIDTSDKDEEWRLINYKILKHYVIAEEIDHSI